MARIPPAYVAGVTGPAVWHADGRHARSVWPGPPHVPLGVPAGLQRSVIENHTAVHMPQPTEVERLDVKQMPGYSYPSPVSHVAILETSQMPHGSNQPFRSHEVDAPPFCQRCGMQHAPGTPCPCNGPGPCPSCPQQPPMAQ